jgi:hypothetical protein
MDPLTAKHTLSFFMTHIIIKLYQNVKISEEFAPHAPRIRPGSRRILSPRHLLQKEQHFACVGMPLRHVAVTGHHALHLLHDPPPLS